MRVTQSMYYNNLYGTNNSKLNKELFDVNKQIASGLQIQYASDNVETFSETMRLDNEYTTIMQVQGSVESGYKFADQADTTLNQFTDNMNRMRVLLLQAANGTQDDTSLDAIADELNGLKSNLTTLANTRINGQYLFSGSSTDVKPISNDGTYQGNDVALKANLGSNNHQQYNVTGAEFFLGEENSIPKKITTNVINTNLLENRADLQASAFDEKELSSESSIRNLMGDSDNLIDPTQEHFFYLRGTASDGTSVKEKIVLHDEDTIQDLLSRVGTAYGNTGEVDIVDVSLNSFGQIVVEDKLKGSSKLDFHMVAAVDYAKTGAADVTNVNDLSSGETDFKTASANVELFVKEFIKSSMTPSAGGGVPADVAASIEGIVYDKTDFEVNGATLSSTVSQIVKETNAFASGSTKLSEVADLTQNNNGTLDGTSLKFAGTNINGNNFNVSIDLNSSANGGSTFSLDTNLDGTPDTTYNIYNMQTPRSNADADEMTYQQLMDVMNMVTTDTLPANIPGSDIEYDEAIKTSNDAGNTFLSYDGKIGFKDSSASVTQATIALYDTNSGSFTTDAAGNVTDAAAVMSFNANNALTVRDAKTDFFKTIDEIISAVENHTIYPNADAANVRNIGIENGVAMIDDLLEHTTSVHSVVGAQANTLSNELERASLLELSVMTLRSSVIDTDLAEASMQLSQLTLNYQAMLSTVNKVSKLSLVNYI